MSRENPYAPPGSAAEVRPVRRFLRIAARVLGSGLLLFSVLPFIATIFLLNQELQIIPLDFFLVGISGPGFSDSQFSMRSLLVTLACITGIAWALGAYLTFWFARPSSSKQPRNGDG